MDRDTYIPFTRSDLYFAVSNRTVGLNVLIVVGKFNQDTLTRSLITCEYIPARADDNMPTNSGLGSTEKPGVTGKVEEQEVRFDNCDNNKPKTWTTMMFEYGPKY